VHDCAAENANQLPCDCKDDGACSPVMMLSVRLAVKAAAVKVKVNVYLYSASSLTQCQCQCQSWIYIAHKRIAHNTPLRRSGMARVLKGSHSFTPRSSANRMNHTCLCCTIILIVFMVLLLHNVVDVSD